jgi:hypothetical protein
MKLENILKKVKYCNCGNILICKNCEYELNKNTIQNTLSKYDKKKKTTRKRKK